MAFQEAVEQMGEMLRWTPEPKKADEKTVYLGEVVNGWYVTKKEKVGQNESNVYEIKLKDGRLVSMWGSSLLDGKFAEIPLGSEVRVSYLGISQPKTPKGRAYQNFRVEFDKDSRAPMAEAAPATPAQGQATAPVAPQATAPAAPTGDTGNGF